MIAHRDEKLNLHVMDLEKELMKNALKRGIERRVDAVLVEKSKVMTSCGMENTRYDCREELLYADITYRASAIALLYVKKNQDGK